MPLGVKRNLSEDDPNDALARDEKCRSAALTNWRKVTNMIKEDSQWKQTIIYNLKRR